MVSYSKESAFKVFQQISASDSKHDVGDDTGEEPARQVSFIVNGSIPFS